MKIISLQTLTTKRVLFWFASIGSFIILYFISSLYSKFNHDEFEAIHSAWKIFNNEIVYQDFFQHHHPLLYYFLIPPLMVFKESVITIFAMKALMFICFLTILYLTYLLSIELSKNKNSGLISIICLCSSAIFWQISLDIRPDVPQTLFGLAAIYFLMRSLRTESIRPIICSSISLGVSFLFLQKAIFFIIAIGCIQLYRLYESKIQLKKIGQYWFFFSMSLLPGLLFLWYHEIEKSYLLWNWMLNLKINNQANPFSLLAYTYKYNSVIILFFIFGMILPPAKGTREHNATIELTIAAFVLFASIFLVKTSHKQYLLPFLPLMAVLSSTGICRTLITEKAIICIVFFMLLFPMYFFIKDLKNNANTAQIEKIVYVMNQTNKDSYVYDGDIQFNLFRKDIDFFWYSVRPQTGSLAAYKTIHPSYNYDIYQQIDKFKPKVISTYFINDLSHPSIAPYYKRSPKYSDLYLRR